MIRPLRIIHRRAFMVLSPLVLLGFALAIYNRTVMPLSSAPANVEKQSEAYSLIAQSEWVGLPLGISLFGFSAEADPVALVIEVHGDFNEADPLLYYTLNELEDGILLGAVPSSGKAFFTLPEIANIYDGKLLIYALASDTIVSTIALPQQSGASL